MLITKEKFNSIDGRKCNFLPWGPDIKSCVEYCNNPSQDLKDAYKMSIRDYENNKYNCNIEDCLNKCNNCEEIDRCQWINPYIKDVNYLKPNIEPDINLVQITNKNPSEFLTVLDQHQLDQHQIVIEWDDKYLSKNYMIHYVEGTQMNNNVRIMYTDLNYFKFSLTENDENITILNPGKTYLFKVYGLNTDKPNVESNILIITT